MAEWVTCRVCLQKTFTYKQCFLWLRWRHQWALRTRMVAPPKHLHHNVALLTRWCLWRLGPTLGWDFDWTNPSDELIHHFLIFSLCALFNFFLELMRNEKWDDWITLLHCSSKKERNQLQTFCQEFRKAQKLLSPEFRLISTWSTLDPAHRPTQIGPKSEWPKKEGGGVAKTNPWFVFLHLEWKTGWNKAITNKLLAEAPGGSFLTPLNGCASSGGSRTSYGSNS